MTNSAFVKFEPHRDTVTLFYKTTDGKKYVHFVRPSNFTSFIEIPKDAIIFDPFSLEAQAKEKP